MDKELGQGQLRAETKNKHGKRPSDRRDGLPDQWESGESDTNRLDEYDLQVYDSLEVHFGSNTESSPSPQKTEYLDTHMDKQGGASLLPDDASSDLSYDPNWRANLKGSDHFIASPRISAEGYFQVPEEKHPQFRDNNIQGPEIKGGYRYVFDSSPSVVVTPDTASSTLDEPYHLHPKDGETGSTEADLSKASAKKETNVEHNNECPKITEDQYGTDFKTQYQQEPECTQEAPFQKSSTSSQKVWSNKQLQCQVEDIVELNKITLGRSPSKPGSYVRAYASKHMPHYIKKASETLEELTPAENQEARLDAKHKWLQKSQQLQVTRINNGKKAKRKKPPVAVVKPEQGECLSIPLAPAADVPQSEPQEMTSSQPVPPSINLNISSHLSSVKQKGQDAMINLASLHGLPHWSPVSALQLALASGCQQKSLPGKSSPIKMPFTALQHQNILIAERWKRTSVLNLPLSKEEAEPAWSSQCSTLGSPTASSQGTSTFTVLPPIGKPLTEEPESSPGQSVNTALHSHSTNSDSYRLQLERQKQLREMMNTKASKDPRKDRNRQYLDQAAVERTKMEQQKLYSDVIREQNKKISRIPFLPTKDPEGSVNKVPRIKALEYAKTIAKPPVKSQPKLREKVPAEEGITEHAALLKALDVSLLTRQEFLGKRHKEKTQAIAPFKKAYAV